MKRLFLLLLLIISIPLSAKENWILTGNLELSYFAKAFSPGFSFRSDVLLFPWDLDNPEDDGYGISMEGGMLFPVRDKYSGISPYFKLGVVGRKDLTEKLGLDVSAHVLYGLIGKEVPGNGSSKKRIRYFQNIGLSASSHFIYSFTKSLDFQTGVDLGILFPAEGVKGKAESPGFTASFCSGISYRFR